jgi:hypothetical protein
MADRPIDDAELSAMMQHFDSREQMYRQAIAECMQLVHAALRRAGGGWASDGPGWFMEDVAPGFHRAIVVKNIDWSGRLREAAIKTLHHMCDVAVLVSGPAKLVNRTHSKTAFEALRCNSANSGDVAVVVAFCE